MNLILFGPPGAGKGTQSKLLCERFHLTHLSTGDLIRAAIRAETDFGRRIKQRVEGGELISDEEVYQLVLEFVAARRSETDSFLFDGFPRTIPQIAMMDDLLERQRLAPPAIVNLDVPEELLLLRITGRRVCLDCKETFNIHFQPPPPERGCSFAACPMLQRADDKPETVRERLRVYHAQTRPLLHHYEMRGNLSSIDGSGSTEDVLERIESLLREHY